MKSRLNWVYLGVAALCTALAACQPDDVADMVVATPDLDFDVALVADADVPSFSFQPESF